MLLVTKISTTGVAGKFVPPKICPPGQIFPGNNVPHVRFNKEQRITASPISHEDNRTQTLLVLVANISTLFYNVDKRVYIQLK